VGVEDVGGGACERGRQAEAEAEAEDGRRTWVGARASEASGGGGGGGGGGGARELVVPVGVWGGRLRAPSGPAGQEFKRK
jgi:hypothetical protein